jgi:hypothetical protein
MKRRSPWPLRPLFLVSFLTIPHMTLYLRTFQPLVHFLLQLLQTRRILLRHRRIVLHMMQRVVLSRHQLPIIRDIAW